MWGNGLNLTSNGICSIYHLGSRLPGTYFWQVIAYNPWGSTVGPVWQFGVAPALPGTLSVSPVGSTRADLTWVLSTDDPTYVDGYRVYADGALAGTVGRGASTASRCQSQLQITSTRSMSPPPGWGSNRARATSPAFGTPTCPPPLLSPANGSTSPSLRPTFTWQAVPDATRLQPAGLACLQTSPR